MKKLTVNAFLTPAVLLAAAVVAHAQTALNNYRVVNLVSNVAGSALVTDPNLVDPWGFSNAGTPFWLSDHGNGLSTLYAANGVANAIVVKIPSATAGGTGKPTGQVQNAGGAAFTMSTGINASFIFATEDGLIVSWANATGPETKINNSAKNAVYKGLAIGTSAAGATLYGANFRTGLIDTWGPGYAPVKLAGSFTDPAVPAGYAPFNIWNIGTTLYVTYAKQDSSRFLDVGGPGTGYVASFDFNGNLIQHLISGGTLNSPWGVAVAPAGWGAFGGALLVGNFGDGRINAFNATTGAPLGTLQDSTGNPIVLQGLWALIFGTGTRADGNTLYFAAGMPNGSPTPRGLLGSIAPPSAITAVANAASWQLGPIAPGEIVAIGGQTVGAIPIASVAIPKTGSIGTTLSGVTVTVNGTAAPIIYTSGSETSFQVPNTLVVSPFSSVANIVVQTPGQSSQSYSVNLAQASPGLFTSGSNGTGPLAALNQDGTVNTAANAATAGSRVTIYATGEGYTDPIGVDGAIQSGTSRAPFLAVSVTIGGKAATVVSAGTPVGTLSGVMAVQVIVPAGLTAGPAPVVLTVGPASTAAQAVTIAVK